MSNQPYGLRPEHFEELHRRVLAPAQPWSVEDQMSYQAALEYGAMRIKDENPDSYLDEDEDDDNT